ncbi:MAG: response regulator transcription factor [Mariprofundus sp.]|nr:response regulator transcription factor [Mariprofundus sp.]
MMKISILTLKPLQQTLPQELVEAVLKDHNISFLEGDGSFSRAEEIIAQGNINIVLANVDGLEALQGISRIIKNGKCRKVLIVGVNDWGVIFEYVKLGVKGCLDRDISPQLITKAVTVVEQGEVWFHRHLSSMVIDELTGIKYDKAIAGLTKRELEVLHLVTQGCKNNDIAQTLYLSSVTVKKHLTHIFKKLGVKDRLSAALMMQKVNKHNDPFHMNHERDA